MHQPERLARVELRASLHVTARRAKRRAVLNVMFQPELLLIREIKPEDVHVLKDIYLQTRAENFQWLNETDLKVGDFEGDTEGEKIWVAELHGQVVGFISVWEPDNFIHHLFVLPKFSGKKIGSALLATCLEIIGRPAQLKCVSANSGALRFYRAKGWQTISRGVSSDGEYQLMQINET